MGGIAGHRGTTHIFGRPVELIAGYEAGRGKVPVSISSPRTSEAWADVLWYDTATGITESDQQKFHSVLWRHRGGILLALGFLIGLADIVVAIVHGIAGFINRVLGSFFGFGLIGILFVLLMVALGLVVWLYALVITLPILGVAFLLRSYRDSLFAKEGKRLMGEAGAIARGEQIVVEIPVREAAPKRNASAEAGKDIASSSSALPREWKLDRRFAALGLIPVMGLLGWLLGQNQIGPAISNPSLAAGQIKAKLSEIGDKVVLPLAQKAEEPAKPPVQRAVAATQPLPPPAAPAGKQVSGKAVMVDTATLDIGGKNVRLAYLAPVKHPGAEQGFKAYLAQAGNLSCREAQEGWSCSTAKGYELTEVLLLSGMAQLSAATAPDALRRAEDDARRQKAGVWGLEDRK
ncbi:MAG: hypothetical protein HZA67_11975 [Rhodospirillales bacterium]|nr:hypothetical protein [Rhodospirillales bacterium]